MAKAIKLLTFTKTGAQAFSATGTCEDKPFAAKTILYGKKGEKQPIFKVQEDGKHVGLEGSKFSRGERIAIARFLKLERIKRGLEDLEQDEKVGEALQPHKPVSKPLDTKNILDMCAKLDEDEEFIRTRTGLNGKKYPETGTSISALR